VPGADTRTRDQVPGAENQEPGTRGWREGQWTEGGGGEGKATGRQSWREGERRRKGRVDDNAVEGLVGVLDLVDCFTFMSIKANLPAKGPDASHARVVRQGSEGGVVLGGQIFKDGIFVADAVGGGIRNCGKRFLLMLENEIADDFRCQLHSGDPSTSLTYGSIFSVCWCSRSTTLCTVQYMPMPTQ
jgi:hypothetical protein